MPSLFVQIKTLEANCSFVCIPLKAMNQSELCVGGKNRNEYCNEVCFMLGGLNGHLVTS